MLPADELCRPLPYAEPMSTTLATLIGLLPFASLTGALAWMSRQ